MTKTELLELALQGEQMTTAAAIVALHLSRSSSYKDRMYGSMLFKQIKEFEKIADPLTDKIIKEVATL